MLRISNSRRTGASSRTLLASTALSVVLASTFAVVRIGTAAGGPLVMAQAEPKGGEKADEKKDGKGGRPSQVPPGGGAQKPGGGGPGAGGAAQQQPAQQIQRQAPAAQQQQQAPQQQQVPQRVQQVPQQHELQQPQRVQQAPQQQQRVQQAPQQQQRANDAPAGSKAEDEPKRPSGQGSAPGKAAGKDAAPARDGIGDQRRQQGPAGQPVQQGSSGQKAPASQQVQQGAPGGEKAGSSQQSDKDQPGSSGKKETGQAGTSGQGAPGAQKGAADSGKGEHGRDGRVGQRDQRPIDGRQPVGQQGGGSQQQPVVQGGGQQPVTQGQQQAPTGQSTQQGQQQVPAGQSTQQGQQQVPAGQGQRVSPGGQQPSQGVVGQQPGQGGARPQQQGVGQGVVGQQPAQGTAAQQQAVPQQAPNLREEVASKRLEDVRAQRREVREGDRTVIREPGRTIVREDNRIIIRRDESDRFREGSGRFGGRVVTERRGTENWIVSDRPDGVQIVTVVDDEGRLVRRFRRQRNGVETIIIDNRLVGGVGGGRGRASYFVELPAPEIRIPRDRYIVEAERASEEEIYETLTAGPVERIDRRYSLDEVRYSPSVRARMRSVDIDTINFETGSWEVTPDQAARLAVIARAIKKAIARNPNEVFLIEGNTDAVGSDVDNLSLSDRRAEAVATILTRDFEIPPENLTTQGYGEQNLKVQTDGPSRENRRVTARRITPLLNGEVGTGAVR